MAKERVIDRALRWARDLGFNNSEFARQMGVGPQDVNNWKHRGMPADRHMKAAQVLGHTVDELVGLVSERATAQNVERTSKGSWRGDMEARIFRIPVAETAQLDPDGHWKQSEHPGGTGDGYIHMPSRDEHAYAVRVIGDSMHPRIKSGEYVVVEPGHECSPGDEVLVRTTDGYSMVREFLFRRGGFVALQGIGAQATRITLPETDISSLHYVAAIAKEPFYGPE